MWQVSAVLGKVPTKSDESGKKLKSPSIRHIRHRLQIRAHRTAPATSSPYHIQRSSRSLSNASPRYQKRGADDLYQHAPPFPSKVRE